MSAQKKGYLISGEKTEQAKQEIAAILQNLKNDTGLAVEAITVKHREGKVDRIPFHPLGAA